MRRKIRLLGGPARDQYREIDTRLTSVAVPSPTSSYPITYINTGMIDRFGYQIWEPEPIHATHHDSEHLR